MLQSCWLGGAAAGAVLLGALYVGCSELSHPGWSGVPSEAERLERLEADREQLERRREVIRSLAAELIEGRLDLRQAAEVWRVEAVNSPPHLGMHVEYVPGNTEEERYCRSLLSHVRTLVEGNPCGPAVLARLEAEYEALAQGRPLSPAPPRRDPRVRTPPPAPPSEGLADLPRSAPTGGEAR
jgi:hypothetical protein